MRVSGWVSGYLEMAGSGGLRGGLVENEESEDFGGFFEFGVDRVQVNHSFLVGFHERVHLLL